MQSRVLAHCGAQQSGISEPSGRAHFTMSISLTPGSRKRRHYDNEDSNDDALFVSETHTKRPKSEPPNVATNSEPGDVRRDSLRDPDEDSADEVAEENDEDEVDPDNDSEGEYDEPYSEKQETYPFHPAFDEQIPEVKKKLAKLAKDALASVTGSPCETIQVNELRRMAEGISVIPEHPKQMIGLIGDAGMGKSSLVNSLCDCPDLAKALDAGKSCTYVITKYERAGPDQKRQFSFTVEFYDSKTIGTVLTKALNDWHIFYSEADEQWTQTEVEQYESRAATCLTTFRAIYSNFPEFRTNELATDMLHRLSQNEGNRGSNVQGLVTQAERVLQPFKQANGTYSKYHEADSTEDLWEHLDNFITEGSDPAEPAPWPLVKQVSVGVRGPRLLDHYVLIDMPGLSDTNEVRVDATQQFLKQCDFLMVVARAGRVVTDTVVVRSILQKYGKAFDGNVMVVCTKSDENVDPKVAKEMENLGYDLGNYRSLKKLNEKRVSQLKTLDRAKKQSARRSSERSDLEAKINRLQRRKQVTDNALWELVVAARNAHNAARLRHDRQHYLPAKKKLYIFGVSNKHYAALMMDEKCADYQLSPEGTGVPQLRQHFLELAASQIWSTLAEFVSSEVNALVPSFKMWAGTGNLASSRTTLVNVVHKQEQQLRADFKQYQLSLMALVDQHIIRPLQSGQITCATSAVAYVQQTLAGRSWNTLKASIRKNGRHQINAMTDSWNDNFTVASTDIIERCWVAFTTQRKAGVAAMEEKMVATTQAILKSVRAGMNHASEASMATFEQALDGHLSKMRSAFRRSGKAFVKQLRILYINATVDGTDNYFTIAMREAYQTCQNDSGKGIMQRCLSVFTTHLSLAGDRSPLTMLAIAFRDSIQTAAAAQNDGLNLTIGNVFRAILRDVNSLALKKSEDPSELRIRRDVAQFVVPAMHSLDAIKEMLQTIESRYPSVSRG